MVRVSPDVAWRDVESAWRSLRAAWRDRLADRFEAGPWRALEGEVDDVLDAVLRADRALDAVREELEALDR